MPLPFYASVTDLSGLARSYRPSKDVFSAEIERLDGVWLFGPHPLSLAFHRIARQRGVPVVLGVRQDFTQYIGNRLPGRSWVWVLPAVWALERAFRRAAKRTPTVAVGNDLARRYSGRRREALEITVSLVRSSDVVSSDEALAKVWDGDVRLLTVSRLDPEKNPLLLADVLAGLSREERGWRLAVVGDGPLAQALEARCRDLGVSDAVELLGHVPNGPLLWEEYRRSHAFLHVSHTEGLPQVLREAQAAGLPVVATDVGGVGAALHGGESGLLVPPDDAQAAVDALRRLKVDGALRQRLIERGREQALAESLEVQIARILSFLQSAVAAGRRGRRDSAPVAPAG